MLRLAFDFIITWRETRTRPNAYNIQVGYTLPDSWTSHLKIKNLRLYFVCDNVYYWSKRKGLDPRRSISGVGTSGKIAPFRTYSGGISLQF